MDFESRRGGYRFKPYSPLWGFLPQVNEWSRGCVAWYVHRVGGPEHIPKFQAIPIFCGQPLYAYARVGFTKQSAKEAAARAMALSGHCVSYLVMVASRVQTMTDR
ncbi:hypothetical protein BXZ70DRAFT_928400 [Cristinia sonorae]|uniref:DRBM domain-containing protein n=1 Tax=Cristinia sonorae TaxID=1940300 RepID=A0A8K0XRD2_9AGAR|nr:hypothetical protein BXZ70DRAFT_928400 [Cristinia sonorae]